MGRYANLPIHKVWGRNLVLFWVKFLLFRFYSSINRGRFLLNGIFLHQLNRIYIRWFLAAVMRLEKRKLRVKYISFYLTIKLYWFPFLSRAFNFPYEIHSVLISISATVSLFKIPAPYFPWTLILPQTESPKTFTPFTS